MSALKCLASCQLEMTPRAWADRTSTIDRLPSPSPRMAQPSAASAWRLMVKPLFPNRTRGAALGTAAALPKRYTAD